MANYIIGLDFGTYQTKAAINYVDLKTQKHEFFEFDQNGSKSYFFPSKVFLLESERLQYGGYVGNDVKMVFNYFKIASAEDKNFRLVSNIEEDLYNNGDNFQGYAPEFLSVAYITYVLLLIKEYLNKKSSKGDTIFGGLFRGLRRDKADKNNFIIRMGLPTEYSKTANLIRRRKFETILLISEMIQENIDYSLSRYLSMPINELMTLVKTKIAEISENVEIPVLLNDRKLSVFPESAAGLLYFVKSGRLATQGIYAAIDIGGGTSDISFFNVMPNSKIKYYASESFMVACNNIYFKYSEEKKINTNNLSNVEEKIITSIKNGEWRQDEKYKMAVKEIKEDLGRRLKYLITEAIFRYLNHIEFSSVIKTLENQPILLYGGGLAHPKIRNWDKIVVFDNGVRDPINFTSWKYMEIKDINLFKPDPTIIINNFWESEFHLLIVAFGLSYLHHMEESYWDDSEYKSISLKQVIEVPHPRNEDMYIYNVIERRFE